MLRAGEIAGPAGDPAEEIARLERAHVLDDPLQSVRVAERGRERVPSRAARERGREPRLVAFERREPRRDVAFGFPGVGGEPRRRVVHVALEQRRLLRERLDVARAADRERWRARRPSCPSRSTLRTSVPAGSSGSLSGGNTNSRACRTGPASARRAKSIADSPIVVSTRRHSRSSARSSLAALELLDHRLGVVRPRAEVGEASRQRRRGRLGERRRGAPVGGPVRVVAQRELGKFGELRTQIGERRRQHRACCAPRARRRRSPRAPRAHRSRRRARRGSRTSAPAAGGSCGDVRADRARRETRRGAGVRRAGARGRARSARRTRTRPRDRASRGERAA